jgi:hypothetical protein
MKSRKPKSRRSKVTRYHKTLEAFLKLLGENQELVQANQELVHTAFQAVVDRDAMRKRIEEMEKAQGRSFFEHKAKR